MDALTAAQPDLSGVQDPSSLGSQDGLARQRQTADQSSAILKLKGLPYTATEDDIRNFFAPYDLKGISFVYEPDGRPSGLAFAEFVSKEEALKALSKNGEYIGQRYVRLLHVPRAEMEEQVRLGTLAIPGAAAKIRSRMMRSQQRNMGYMAGPVQLMPSMMPSGRPVMGMGPPGGIGAPYGQTAGPAQTSMESRLWQPAYGQSAYGAQQQHGSVQAAGGQGGLAGAGQQPGVGGGLMHGGAAAAAGYGTPTPAQLAAQFGGLGLGGGPGGGQAGGAGGGMGGLGGPRGGMGGGAGAMQLGSLGAQALHSIPPPPAAGGAAGLGAAGPYVAGTRVVQTATSPTIKIRGLPYGSSPSEILGFFQTYHFLPDTLQIGLDQLGRPSGEAWLSFTSPQEALRAVRDLNRHYLGNRYLELSIC
ncbi:hypothetical protein HYH02_003110 [Chlamydomonas schloesseri]|uniref:RRM domain-containing protein n=1 Tax=Chlamydomonas schloesseri TaxID=2026947 RepID=A0A835WRG4_9CHLO|nr:hypothetical protein HYH02_003110 [Chlamydomonas schloesseri]|eukprot:KAG2452074.1 hypothetical protein HYH02_003110 [Chlamydomonas schloesseri]